MASPIIRTSEFSWGPVIAGAVAAVAVSFLLITLGAGVGLALAGHTGAPVFLTLGAIYFLAAQAFGLAVGGHLTGRLIGPMVENTREEEFRAGAHGLVMWALAVVVSLGVAAMSSAMASGTISAGLMAQSNAAPVTGGYWLDTLFGASGNSPQVAADKAEVSQILAYDMAHGGFNDGDTNRVARLVAADTGQPLDVTLGRVSDSQARMQEDAADARKAGLFLALWTAFALLFGGVVAVAAAVSGRWEDDKVSFGFARRIP